VERGTLSKLKGLFWVRSVDSGTANLVSSVWSLAHSQKLKSKEVLGASMELPQKRWKILLIIRETPSATPNAVLASTINHPLAVAPLSGRTVCVLTLSMALWGSCFVSIRQRAAVSTFTPKVVVINPQLTRVPCHYFR
jgi:hypothetical protein